MKKLKDKLKDFKCTIRTIFNNLKRMVSWLPVIWKDRDFDYNFILEILAFKLSRVRKEIVRHNMVESAEEIGNEIACAEALIDRIIECDYCKKEWATHEEKWGELIMGRIPLSNGMSQLDMYRVKAREQGLEAQERTESCEIIALADERIDLDYETLFALLRNKIRGWWD